MPGIKILQEIEQTTYQYPGQVRKQMVILYQAEGMPPRTVWVYKDLLPDLVWLEEHPGETEAPEDLERKGDEIRQKAITEDLEKLRLRKPRELRT